MTPSERLLETLEKYGELAKEVQLTLILSGPPATDKMTRSNVGRYQQCPPLRRKDAGARTRHGSSSVILHRQSLPTLPEHSNEDVKRPKRKSLTFMEEAREWLDSLGKGKVYSTSCDKESNKKADKKSRKLSLISEKENLGRGVRGKVKGHRGSMSALELQTSCCIGGQTRCKEGKHCKHDHRCVSDSYSTEDEKNSLKESVISQLAQLQDLELQIARVDKEISELEEKQKTQRAEQEAQERALKLEMEQIKLWEHELKAEEGHEKELQSQFVDLKDKVVECKVKLEEYKNRIPGVDLFTTRVEEHSQIVSKVAATVVSETDAKQQQSSDADRAVNVNRKFLPRDACSSPRALVPPNQIKERRPTGPTELREWWTRWSEAQSPPLQAKKKVIHRSELTIYLGSTKV